MIKKIIWYNFYFQTKVAHTLMRLRTPRKVFCCLFVPHFLCGCLWLWQEPRGRGKARQM